MNTLYYGDNLHILREHIADEYIDTISRHGARRLEFQEGEEGKEGPAEVVRVNQGNNNHPMEFAL